MFNYNNIYCLAILVLLLSCNEVNVHRDSKVVLTEIKMYPNPATDVLSIKVDRELEDPIKFRIVNTYGRDELRGELFFDQQDEQFIEISHFSEGFYTIHFQLNESKISRRLLKQ